MSNKLLLFHSPKPRSQVRILIYQQWSISPNSLYFESRRETVVQAQTDRTIFFRRHQTSTQLKVRETCIIHMNSVRNYRNYICIMTTKSWNSKTIEI